MIGVTGFAVVVFVWFSLHISFVFCGYCIRMIVQVCRYSYSRMIAVTVFALVVFV